MTPRRIAAAMALHGAKKTRDFVLTAKATLIGAQGDPKKTGQQLDAELRK